MFREVEFEGCRGAGFKIAGRELGERGGEPWLMLHGFLDNAASFELLCQEFVRLRPNVQILCLDMAGHGLSSHTSDGVYHIVDNVADVWFVITQLGWSKFNVIGHSMGGGVAACLAGSFPEHVHRLVLIEALGPFARPPSEVPSYLREAVEKHVKSMSQPSQQNLKVFSSPEAAAQRRSEGNIVNELPLTAATVLCSRGLKQTQDGAGFVWASDPRLLARSRLSLDEHQVMALLGSIKAPTLLLLAKDGLFRQLWALLSKASR
eukprot:c14445_g1_i2.p1 GENE.c14445_g1_i2~~c14445_g1_i2.p1  ORF type:complete len:263 (+),score=41.79 c14445_g1_i2:34-822(+)